MVVLHLFDPIRHELTLATGELVCVPPSRRGHWPLHGERLARVALQWACQIGVAECDDEMAVIEYGGAPCAV